jgi:hypothetical protein
MPRRHKHKKMRGGFDFSSIGSTFSSWGNNVSNWGSSLKNKLSGLSGSNQYSVPATSTTYAPATTSTYAPATAPTSTGTYSTGGKKRYTRSKRGGLKGWTPLTGIAAHGYPVSGLAVAKAHTYVGGPKWIGGKTKRRHSKRTRRHHKR